MSNKEQLLYNPDTKLEYLSRFDNPDVRELISFMFVKSKGTEEHYGKDLYSFDLDQIDQIMRNINPTTLNSVANNKSRINMYINWAIENGRRTNNINPLQGTGSEWAKKFIDKTSKRHFSSTELADLTSNLYNAQDKALVQCIFEGILGHGMSELISMNINNINWQENKVLVKDDGTDEERIVIVSDKCLRFIEEAYKEESYLSEDTETEKELQEYRGHIFKNVKWRTTRNEFISRGNLAKRLGVIKSKYEMDQFSANTISESGRIKIAADLMKERGKITQKEFTIIGDKFNIPKIKVRDYEYYDISKMKNYINKRNLKELYEIDLVI